MIRGVPRNALNSTNMNTSSFDQNLLKEICKPLHGITDGSTKIPILIDNDLKDVSKVELKDYSHIEMLELNIMRLHQDQLRLSDEIHQALFGE